MLHCWLDGKITSHDQQMAGDLVFADEKLVEKAREIIASSPDEYRKASRQRVFDELESFSQRVFDLLGRAEDDPAEGTVD